jgi:hypothetical protein
MQYLLTAEGENALVCHNERLADPLDPIVRQLAAITKKRLKTEADHLEVARLEFFGGLYMSGDFEVKEGHAITGEGSIPCVPGWNVLRCLQDGAKRHKRGQDVLRGIHPIWDNAKLIYSGPTDPQEMWETGEWSLRKTVGVQRARTMRTRPIFYPWRLHLAVEIDPTVFDVDTLKVFWADAGRYCGLGEMRPVYGRFVGAIEDFK